MEPIFQVGMDNQLEKEFCHPQHGQADPNQIRGKSSSAMDSEFPVDEGWRLSVTRYKAVEDQDLSLQKDSYCQLFGSGSADRARHRG